MIKSSYVVLFLVFLILGCSESKEETTRQTSPRVKKATKIEEPVQNQVFTRGAEIPMRLTASGETPIDSVEITINEISKIHYQTTFNISLPGRQVGTWRVRTKVYCGDQSETHYRKVIVLPEVAPQEMTYRVINTHPHNTKDYTQGLLINKGALFESTGQRGESSLKMKDIQTGQTEKTVNLASNEFGEGLALLNNQFYQLTWTSGRAYVYDTALNRTASFSYQIEGWGLTNYEDQLLMTDGSEKVYFIDPTSFTIIKEQEVYSNEGKVEALNELELIEGLLYANVYQEDYVVVIDPDTGEVLQQIDFTGLLSEEEATKADVLNGIALDSENDKIYVTGKWWPKLFEVVIEPKTIQ